MTRVIIVKKKNSLKEYFIENDNINWTHRRLKFELCLGDITSCKIQQEYANVR